MACCGFGQTAEEKAASEIDTQINKEQSKLKHAMKREQKILLLGTGECGKSTFIKQMRIILGGGFPPAQRAFYKKVIHKNLLQSCTSITSAMKMLNIDFDNQVLYIASSELEAEFNDDMEGYDLTPQQVQTIKMIWADAGTQDCYMRRREYQLLDSASYFLDKIDELTEESYLPELQDILRSRVRTTGIIEEIFKVEGANLKIIDVGGQRRERRKWIHCFECVTSVIFLASLSEYDLNLLECKNRNRTKESLQLFTTIIEYPWFQNSSLILFLNKRDLFEEKIQHSHIIDYFPEYEGSKGNVEEGKVFMASLYKNAYLDSNKDEDGGDNSRALFLHFTCATDTESIKKVFQSVKSTLLQNNIAELNLG